METVEQFLARGGKIEQVESGVRTDTPMSKSLRRYPEKDQESRTDRSMRYMENQEWQIDGTVGR